MLSYLWVISLWFLAPVEFSTFDNFVIANSNLKLDRFFDRET